MVNAMPIDARPAPKRGRKLRLPGGVAERGSMEYGLLFAAVILLYWVYAGLGRDIFFNKLNDPTAYDPIGQVINYVRLVVCIYAVAVVTLHTTFNWALSRVPWQFAPFMLLALASTLWADDKGGTLQNAVLLISIWVSLSMVMYRLGAAETVRAMIHLVAVVCILSFLLAVLVPSIGRHTGLEAVQYTHVGRWRGIFGHKNALGPWAAYGSVFLFTHSWMVGGPRIYWWFARFCALMCLIFAQSSTAVVMALALIVLWFLLRLLRRNSGSLVGTLVVVAGAIGVALYMTVGEALFEALGRDMTLTGRTVVWDLAVSYFWQAPMLGHGYQSLGGPEFLAVLEQTLQQAIPGAESGYMTLLLNLGIVGFVLFFIPFLGALRSGLEWLPYVGRDDRGAIEFMVMTLACVLVHAVTETGALVAISFDGVLSFGALFFLATLPRSPEAILRREFRKSRNWRKQNRRSPVPPGERTLGDVV